ncbi:hypothetical protein BT63DRAFT_440727 [Microthyrium microscopicum]|uniref:Mid2 domain-containing protein n=1 Tax=Microthyrium microscopicum TaxID=703497 RepID=A0A6A6U9E7_9PEZI|nr:hypothetical protein BT63DRAFT_440727 [Microthyrium microscopicum]
MSLQCFSSAGIPTADVPCDSTANVTTCCSSSALCATNLFCIDQSNNKVSGSCTEKSWGTNPTESCPCPPVYGSDGSLDLQSTFTKCQDGSYCCGKNNQACCNQAQGQFGVLYRPPRSGPAGCRPSGGPCGRQTVTTTATVAPTTINQALNNASVPTTVANIAPGNQSSMPVSSAQQSSGFANGQMSVGVIAGLATPLVLLLGACVFLFFRLRLYRMRDRGFNRLWNVEPESKRPMSAKPTTDFWI